jgi:hypothetical protein
LNPEVERQLLQNEMQKRVSVGNGFGSEAQIRTSVIYQELISKLLKGDFDFCPCSVFSGLFKGKIPVKMKKNLDKVCGEACNTQQTVLTYEED